MTARLSHRTQGSALLIVMMVSIIILSMIGALWLVTQSAANDSQSRVDYALALEAPQAGLQRTLALIQQAKPTVVDGEYHGFVQADLDPGSTDTRTVWGTINGTDYVVTVRSAYWAHYDDNVAYDVEADPAPSIQPDDDFLRLVPKGVRDNADEELFDVYQVRSYVTTFQRDAGGNIVLDANNRPVEITETSDTDRGLGEHGLRRGVDAIVEIYKEDINVAIPSAMYIDGDPDPQWTGSSWQISGADHSMYGPQEECTDCEGTGVVQQEDACANCGGDGQVDVQCGACQGFGRTGGHCNTCSDTGFIEGACTACAASGWIYESNGAAANPCTFCESPDGLKANGNDCNKCRPCDTCHGDGTADTACPDCTPCAVCGGDGLVPATCTVCGGTGNGGGIETPCPTCGGDGQVDGDSGTGQPVEADWRVPNSEDNKSALGYPGDWADASATMNDGTQVITVNEAGNTIDGESAYTQTKVDLRELAASFVGGPVTDPLDPDTDRVDNWMSDMGSNGFGMGPNGMGDRENFEVTYVSGDSGTVAGQIEGAGVLIVDGDLKISGQMTWYGLVICLGNIEISGGGSGTHIFGACMGAEMTDSTQGDSKIGGQTDIWWCQEAMDKVYMQMMPTFRVYPKITVWRSLDKAEVQLIAP